MFYTKNKITQKIFFLALLLVTITSYAQIVNFDGNNCILPSGDEWGIPDVVDGQDSPTGTADILNFWFDQDTEYIYLAFDRRATGNSSFSFFMNTDCNSSTGDSETNGSEIAAFFAISPGSNPSITDNTLFTWNGSMFIDTGVTFEAMLGKETCDGDLGLFFELKIKISDIFNVCDITSVCNSVTIEVGASLAGGSPNSSLKDDFTVPLYVGINSIPTAVFEQNNLCAGATTSFDAANSTYYNSAIYNIITAPDFNDAIVLYEWDFNYNGITFNVDITGVNVTHVYTTIGNKTTALRVTDKYGCTDISTQIFTVFDSPQPLFVSTPDVTCGYTINFDAATSIDPTNGGDLIYKWDFNYDGTTFNQEASTVSVKHTFNGCGIYKVALQITDPTTPEPCKTVLSFKEITVKDTIKPTFTVPNDAIIYADENCNFDASVAKTGDVSDESDNCDTTLSATFTDATIAGSC
ncbi:PKD domain-containing protein, partial [Tenacibaculum finnmarkense]|uniref:PKD domain-containing protein n=1 Tax=Tenacibaculum finnmarkense TaxID=2781243 RepID=UPI003BB60A54